jgi:hypothetical protein
MEENAMAFDDMDMEEFETEEQGSPPAEQSNNRNFLIAAGGLAALMILTLICAAVYALVILPNSRADRLAMATSNAQTATAMADSVNKTQEAAAWTPTSPPTATKPPATVTPTSTSVVAVLTPKPSSTPTSEVDPRTATVEALFAKATEAAKTIIPTSTLLPNSGFADDVGLPGLMGIGILLIVVIFVARRLRAAG